MTTILEYAQRYTARGWSVIPIPHRSKNPGFDGWQLLRLIVDELPARFNGQPRNIGVLLGAPSAGLIDVDLDHPRAIELASTYLPPTPAIFGRRAKPRSHWLYRVTRPVETKKYKSKSAGMIVETRSSGTQTVFPPSTHESGEAINWSIGAEEAEPLLVDPELLAAAVKELAHAVLAQLGETPRSSQSAPRRLRGRQDRLRNPPEENASVCLAAMLRMTGTDHNDGSSRLYAAACRAVEHNLDDAAALAVIRDYAAEQPFPHAWTDQEILQRVRDAERKCTRGEALHDGRPCLPVGENDDRPEIVITTDEHIVNDAALKALSRDDTIFQRGAALVHIVRGGRTVVGINRPTEARVIAGLPAAVLRERLTCAAKFVVEKCTKNGEVERILVHPPTWSVKAIHARGFYPNIRPLEGLVESAVLRPDGTILETPGYDEGTGLLYLPGDDIRAIEPDPSREDALVALHVLLDVVCDFPFESESHRSAWLAALLTVIGRHAIDGPVPLFLFDANVRGSGKTLQAETISFIATGRTIPRTPNPRNNEEARKMILAVALSGDPLVLIDNVTGQLGTAALDAALTATVWKDRILKESRIVTAPLMLTWLASGNNVILGANTCRRVCHCRLDCRDERPEEREGFRHPDLTGYVREHRVELLGAALTVLRAYFVAGRPQAKLRPWGSYEAWSSIIRQCVVWLGLPDPGTTREELRNTADQEARVLGAMLDALREADPAGTGMTSAGIIAAMQRPGCELLREAVHQLCGTTPERPPSSRSLGNRLQHLKRRVVGGRAIDSCPGRGGFASWRVISSRGPSGTASIRDPSTNGDWDEV
jgi:hypothetical protein